MTNQIKALTSKDFKTITLDRSGRLNRPHVHESVGVQLTSYPGTVRQLIVTGLGHQAPTPVGAPVAGPVALPALAIDAKALRGAIGADGQIPSLLAAATHGDSAVIAERLIGAKTNEVPEFPPLLRGLPLGGWVLSMDAAHTVRAHAEFLAQELLAHYVMIAKENQKGLLQRWDSLDWASVPVSHRKRGHRSRPPRTPHHPGPGRSR